MFENNVDHWLTFLYCSACRRPPEDPLLYECYHQHRFCSRCYRNEVQGNLCPLCVANPLHVRKINPDILKKVVMTPGIGRPCRYPSVSRCPSAPVVSLSSDAIHEVFSECGHADVASSNRVSQESRPYNGMTIERLFKKPREVIDKLLNPRLQMSNGSLNVHQELSRNKSSDVLIIPTSSRMPKFYQDAIPVTSELGLGHSRKPIRCLETKCGKTVACSSFRSHYLFDHKDLLRADTTKGQVNQMSFSLNIFDHNGTVILCMLTLKDPISECVCPARTVDMPVWVLLSTHVPEAPHSDTYLLAWLFALSDTNPQRQDEINVSDHHLMAVLELSSSADLYTVSTCCPVNSVHDSREVTTMAKGLRSLYVSDGLLRTMTAICPKLTLRVTIT